MKQTFTILFACALLCTKAYSQKVDSLKLRHVNYLKKELAINDAKAGQVITIQEQYKAAAKKVISDSALSPEDKKEKFQKLIDEKNQKLRSILTEEQLKKAVPTSELAKK